MSAKRWTRIALSGAAMGLVLSGCAGSRIATSPTGFALGSNASGEECVASPNWTDTSLGDSSVKFLNAVSVSCLGNTSGALARVRVFDTTAERDGFTGAFLKCPSGATPQPVTLEGFSNTTAIRCYDPALGSPTMVINTQTEDAAYQISSAFNAVGAGYQAARIMTGLDSPSTATSDRTPFDLSAIPDLPAGFAQSEARNASGESLESLVSRGATLNFRGLHADASRFLRSELANLPADADRNVVVALQLEAALADSNIEFFATASDYFAKVEAGLGQLSAADQDLLRPKLQIYKGLDALNRNEFDRTIVILSAVARNNNSDSAADLTDVSTLIQLNSGVGGDASEDDTRTSIALPDENAWRAAFLDILGDWALSVAQLSQTNSDPAAAGTSIESAATGLAALERSLDQGRIGREGLLWLRARILRQRGRVEAAEGRFTAAIDSFDKAIVALRRGAIARLGTGREPAVAELQLERASLFSRSGASARVSRAAYQTAVDALIEVRDDTATISTGLLQPYLDILADDIANGSPAVAQDAATRYFEALQVAGESGAARQMSALQEIVGQEAGIASRLRDRQDLARKRSQIDLQIDQAEELGLSSDAIANLRTEQATLRDQYRALDAELQGVARFNQVSNTPAQLGELQSKLRDKESYVRLTVMGDRVFGMLVQKDQVHPIRPEISARDLTLLTDEVRKSIDRIEEEDESGNVVTFNERGEFDVVGAVALYRALFEPLDGIIRSSDELIVDGGEVLAGLPASALVSDRAGPRNYLRQDNRQDYSTVEFVANIVPTSVAMSPRSFVNSRNLAKTEATQDLLGFAAPVPVANAARGSGSVQIGNCTFTPTQLAQLSRRFTPIPSIEIEKAHAALGSTGSLSLISQSAFTDQAVRRLGRENGELSDYKVLHFATHGLSEGQLAEFGCLESPAALLTSLGDGSSSNLLLDIEEIAQLRLDANLVVLSACSTASAVGEQAARRSGATQVGSTLEGMVRAFLAAQARAVMATYWETPNTGESEVFMERFYTAGKTSDISTALNQAQKGLISNPASSHPYYWGSFFVVGDTDNRMLDSASGNQVALR